MPTGDGLLVRLIPTGTIALSVFAEFCAAARKHGNGVIEITSRGSIQIRGLNPASAPRFAAHVAALGIAAEDGVSVLCNALAGLDAEEILDAGALAADLRHALTRERFAARLAAKVSIAVDGGGALGLESVAADIRLIAEAIDGGAMLRVSVGGDAAGATPLGCVAPAHGVEAATRLLEVLAKRGRDARARNIIATDGTAAFRSAIAGLLTMDTPRPARRSADAIGLHPLRDGLLACGIGLAFGHADAISLERLIDAAAVAGAHGLRAAAGRALMIIGLMPERSSAFAASAEELGFIVRAGDPRRHVVACAGAPICAFAHIAARAMAPRIAEIAAHRLAGAFTIHISGCAKGCARAAPAALTVVGTPEGCALIANGTAHDAAFAVVPTNELPAAIAKYAREHREAGHV